MMTMEKCSNFVKKYSLIFILGCAFLTSFTYIFKELSFTTTGGIIFRCFVSVLILAFAFFYFYKNTKSFRIKTILLLTIYVVSGVIATFVTPAIVHANVSGKLYFESLVTIGMNAISIFVFFDHLSSKHEDYDNNNLVCYIVMWFAFFLTISTYVFQFKEIGNSFTQPDGWNYNVTSIFYSKTIYGFVLFAGALYATIIMFNKNQLYYLFVPFYFAINAFISRNKTSLLLILFVIVVSFVLFTIKNRKEKRKELTITLSIIGGIITIFSLLTFVEPLRFGIFNNIYYFIKTSLIENAKTVIDDRFAKWGNAFNNLKPFGYVFGYGEKITQLIFDAYGTPVSDSTYISTLFTGGIIKLALLLLFIIYIFKTYYKSDFTIYKKILITLVIGSILIAGLVEDDYIYGFNLTCLFVAPMLFGSNKLINNI